MFLGIELIKDLEKRTPATVEAQIAVSRFVCTSQTTLDLLELTYTHSLKVGF